MCYHLLRNDADWPHLAVRLGVTPTPMPDSKFWQVGDEIVVHRGRIADYVANDPELQRHAQTILYGDWPDLEAHLVWVASVAPDEVSDWARSIERDAPDPA